MTQLDCEFDCVFFVFGIWIAMIGGSAYTIAETKVFKYLQVVHRGYVVSFGLAKFLPNVVEVDDFINHVS